MWSRLLRALATLFNIYAFYQNPVRYILSLLLVLIIPYLIYIFWGTLVIIGLIVLGIYLIYRLTRNRRRAYN